MRFHLNFPFQHSFITSHELKATQNFSIFPYNTENLCWKLRYSNSEFFDWENYRKIIIIVMEATMPYRAQTIWMGWSSYMIKRLLVWIARALELFISFSLCDMKTEWNKVKSKKLLRKEKQSKIQSGKLTTTTMTTATNIKQNSINNNNITQYTTQWECNNVKNGRKRAENGGGRKIPMRKCEWHRNVNDIRRGAP